MSLIQLKRLTITKTINETEEKITNHDHDKYFTIPQLYKLTEENFTQISTSKFSKQKKNCCLLVKNTDFDDKLKNLNENLTSNKSKHFLIENKLKTLTN